MVKGYLLQPRDRAQRYLALVEPSLSQLSVTAAATLLFLTPSFGYMMFKPP